MRQESDEELMIAYQNGRESAFTELYSRHKAKIYGYLRKKLGPGTSVPGNIVDDAFQMTWLKLHQSRQSYNPAFPFLPWLFTICRNSTLDLLRVQIRVEHNESPSTPEIETHPATEQLPKIDFEPNLESLPMKYKEALELRFVHDLSFEELAKQLEISPANARQRVSRAIKSLKKWFEQRGGEK